MYRHVFSVAFISLQTQLATQTARVWQPDPNPHMTASLFERKDSAPQEAGKPAGAGFPRSSEAPGGDRLLQDAGGASRPLVRPYTLAGPDRGTTDSPR